MPRLKLYCLALLLILPTVYLGSTYTRSETATEQPLQRVNRIYAQLALYVGSRALPVQLLNDQQVNAWTDGSRVVITTGLLKHLKNDDEIAAVLAHEMAHEMLHHISRPNDTTVNMEDQADKMGMYLMMRAGFDPCKGREFVTALAKLGGDYADPELYGHPSYAFRYQATSMPWCPL